MLQRMAYSGCTSSAVENYQPVKEFIKEIASMTDDVPHAGTQPKTMITYSAATNGRLTEEASLRGQMYYVPQSIQSYATYCKKVSEHISWANA